jgi:hypothetical protein
MSYWLLALLAVLMTVDLFQTLKGLRLGLVETNPCAAACVRHWGTPGLIVYQVAWFCLPALLVAIWPGQWGAPLLACLAIAAAIAQNARLLGTRST